MARMTFKAGDEYALKLSQMSTGIDEISKKAIYAGVKIVADKIKANLIALPEDQFRRLKPTETFSGLPKDQKLDLIESLGIAKIDRDKNGDWNTKIGFDGYGKKTTRKYPKGIPNQMIARAVESGSSVRQKTPFVRPAVDATRKDAQAEMGRVIEEEIKKLMK